MYKNVFLFLFLFVALISFGCSQKQSEIGYSYHVKNTYKAEANVVRVRSINGNFISHGTGFFITNKQKTYLVTALHVHENTNHRLELQTVNRKQISFDIVKKHTIEPADVVLVEVENISENIIPYQIGELKWGVENYVIGYPKDSELRVARGILDSIELGTTSDCEIGMSGSPIIVDGKVVGIMTKKPLNSKGGYGESILSVVKELE